MPKGAFKEIVPILDLTIRRKGGLPNILHSRNMCVSGVMTLAAINAAC